MAITLPSEGENLLQALSPVERYAMVESWGCFLIEMPQKDHEWLIQSSSA
jgi:hypothetical protein